jgi:hypothetical protein
MGLGTDPEYLAARIARDSPDIQSKMKDGGYPKQSRRVV